MIIKKIASLLIISSLFFSVSFSSYAAQRTAKDYVAQMSLEEKVAQMFIVEPDAFMKVSNVTKAGSATKEAIYKTPVGGFIYMEYNLISKSQTKEMLSNTQKYSFDRTGLPMFLCVDEEGGTVSRISGRADYGVTAVENMRQIGAKENYEKAYEIGKHLGKGLSDLGFNVDFAPVADVLTNDSNTVVKKRSFGENPEVVKKMSANVARGLKSEGILATYKHFPGHGATAQDTHAGFAISDRTLDELLQAELLPFADAVKEDIPMIMVGHIDCTKIVNNHTPASLSKIIVTDILRKQMKYDGLIITDALNMGAIYKYYSSAEAAVEAVMAGNDLLLMPYDFEQAYNGVLNAVRSGKISEERINQSVEKIIERKQALNNNQR